jgi:hypothetical protein
VTIADEVDAQLKQQMLRFYGFGSCETSPDTEDGKGSEDRLDREELY